MSSNFLATICRPAGSLMLSSSCAGTKPTGMVRAGCPVPVVRISDSFSAWPNPKTKLVGVEGENYDLLLKGAVLPTSPTLRERRSSGPCADGSSKSLQGGEGRVGITRTSTSLRAWLYSS